MRAQHALVLAAVRDFDAAAVLQGQGTPSVALKVRRVKADGVTYGPAFTLESVPSYDERVTTSEIVGGTDAGVEIWIEKVGTASATIDIKAMTGRLLPLSPRCRA